MLLGIVQAMYDDGCYMSGPDGLKDGAQSGVNLAVRVQLPASAQSNLLAMARPRLSDIRSV